MSRGAVKGLVKGITIIPLPSMQCSEAADKPSSFPYYMVEAYRESRFPVHLQWFAAEDEGRTEEPTEYKIRKAREEGKVAKSADLTSALILLFCVIALAALGGSMVRTLLEMLRFFLLLSVEADITSDGQIVNAFLNYFVRLTLPLAAISFITALLGNIVQVGFLFSSKPITPDFNRIVPKFSRFVQRAFLSREAAFNFAKSVVKIILVGTIAFIIIRADFPKIARTLSMPFILSLQTLSGTAFKIILGAAVALLVFSLPDYLFQKRLHLESLKMSKQEIKEERKMVDGDPLVRSRLRERMRQLLTQNMLQNVPKADVVVTNPTHFAVALEWNREKMVAPMVTAKGQDNMAFKIRELAEKNNVPLVENKPFARALYAEIEIGDVIPEKYYQVMAVILAEVYKMRNQAAV